MRGQVALNRAAEDADVPAMVALRARARAGRDAQDEQGFSIFEVVVGVAILALLAGGMATTTHAGLGLVGSSKSRQTATQVAARAMEESRATPYDALGLPSDTVFESGDDNPDAVVSGGTAVTYGGLTEQIVFVAPGSGVLHHEHATLNEVDYAVHRFVTWAARDANPQAYKRVRVVVQWEGSDTNGNPNRVELGTIIGPNGVAWQTSATSTTLQSSTTTSSTSSTSTTLVANESECPDPNLSPATSMIVLAGTGANQGYTNGSSVSLTMTTQSPCRALYMRFSNDGVTYSDYEPFASSKVWALSSGNGTKTIYGRFKANNGKVTALTQQVRVDATPPTQPGGYGVQVETKPSRMIPYWSPSTDNDRLIGYYVFKKIDNSATFQNVTPGVTAPCPTSPCTFVDNDVQSGKNYSYYVVAYDAAGNMSLPTATVQKRAA